MSSSSSYVFPLSPAQEDITFLSEDSVPLQIEGKVTKNRGSWGAVICHPHPLHGGTMTNKVVDTAMRTVAACGGTALRFNFRGVGRSEGEYGEGIAEVGDLVGAVAYLRETQPSLFPLWLIGFSFGTRVISYYMKQGHAADGVTLIAPPLDHLGVELFSAPEEGVHMILGEHDEFCSEASLYAFQREFHSPDVSAMMVPDSDHFFHGHLPKLSDWVRSVLQGERKGGLGAV